MGQAVDGVLFGGLVLAVLALVACAVAYAGTVPGCM